MTSSLPFDAEPEPGDAPRRSRTLVVGGVVAAMALGAGGFLLLGGSDVDDEAYHVATAAPAAPAAEPAPQAAVVPLAVTAPIGRNPFKAQYVEPAGPADGAPVTTPKEIIEQSRPAAGADELPAPLPATGAPATGSPATGSAPAASVPPAAAKPAPGTTPVSPPAPVDDGVRYPVTLQALDVEADGIGGQVRWGYAGNSLHVRPGVNFGRFTHLRVVQVVDAAERQGVMLQWGDGAPYFVAVGETVYVL